MDNILLTKDGESRTVKPGNAWYILLVFIPFVGSIIFLVLSIIRKQFKGIFLNEFLLGAILSFAFFFVSLLVGLISLKLGAVIMMILSIGVLIFGVVLYVDLVSNANKYSLSQYLADGYEITNENELGTATKMWLEENKNKERAKFLLIKF